MDIAQTAETHTLARTVHIAITAGWLDGRAARAVFSPGARDGVAPGWIIENRDGSIVLARLGDTLSFDGVRITRR